VVIEPVALCPAGTARLSCSDEFHDVLQYFGESPRDTTSSDWFTDHTQPGRPFWVNKLSLAVPAGHNTTGSLIKLNLAVPAVHNATGSMTTLSLAIPSE